MIVTSLILLSLSFLLQLEHMFKHRLNSSYRHAVEYVKQFPSPITSMIAKLVSYIAGSFAAVILLISLIDESLLEGHVSILVLNYLNLILVGFLICCLLGVTVFFLVQTSTLFRFCSWTMMLLT